MSDKLSPSSSLTDRLRSSYASAREYLGRNAKRAGNYCTALGLSALLACSSGCLSIVRSDTEGIEFLSDPMGATVKINGQLRGTTPSTIQLYRSEKGTVSFEKEGYRNAHASIYSQKDWAPLIVGNFFSWSIIGMIIDSCTDSSSSLYPKRIYATLEKSEETEKTGSFRRKLPSSLEFLGMQKPKTEDSRKEDDQRIIELFKRLESLRKEGVLSEEEYQIKKQALIKGILKNE